MASTSNTTAQMLMNKGKHGAAAYIHQLCVNSIVDSKTPQQLKELLDVLLNPSKPIYDWETIDWCKWLIAGGQTPEEFASTVRQYDNATICGLVWTPNFVAYRCRTCSISPCMSLCTECFKRGNHHRHDFNMFLSQAGGACDCGDTSVMKEIGFCDRHGPKAAVDKSAAPADLMCVAEAMMPRIILRLIQHLRENLRKGEPNKEAIQDAGEYFVMLLDWNNMGALMRHVMTSALTSPEIYKVLSRPSIFIGKTEPDPYSVICYGRYKKALKSLPNPEPPDEYKEYICFQENMKHSTFLEELMFWTVVYEFPQKLVCVLLNMLPDPDYKDALTRAFVLHYSRISMMLERSFDPDTLSNRVVHISVQLFSNERLALKMVDQLKVLHIMLVSLRYMMGKILIQNTLHDPDKNFHYVVDCAKPVMKEHCYWPLVSDLNNLLSHKPVAVRFISNDTLLEMWFDFLSMFQGMNVNHRELNEHVEFESTTYYAAFSAELEASAYPMWALVSHLRGPESAALSKRVLAFCLSALHDWLDAINFTDPNVNDTMQVSFHLPLHRYFAVFMCQAVRQKGATLNELLPPTDVLHLLMMHPLRVQVLFYEILNEMWVRNGLQIKGQAMTYIQCNFCNSMVDADLYLLQVCATKLPADVFLKTVIEKFQIRERLRLSLYNSENTEDEYLGRGRDTPMLESCLTFLATLISVRTNLGLPDQQMSCLEMVTLLCMGDKTHSQLMELMPERSGTPEDRDFESVLAQLAQYRAPNLEASGTMQQGMYGPKPRVWEELFDPLHVLLRAVHRGDFQISMGRFTEYAKQAGKLKSSATPWPPFRHPAPVSADYDDPRIVLRTRVFHALIFITLYKAANAQNISEHTLALAIYLLEMAVVTAEAPDKPTNLLCQYTGGAGGSPRVIKNLELDGWFESDNLSVNLRTVIPRVLVQVPSVSDSDIQWEVQGEMTDDMPPLMLNDSAEESTREEVLALPSVDTVSEDSGLSTATNVTTLPALPAADTEHSMAIVPEEEIITIRRDEDDLMVVQRALPPSTEPSPSPNNMIVSQPALPPPHQRLAVTAVSNESSMRLHSNSISSMTEIVPSTSNSHKFFTKREPQARTETQSFVKVGESIISLLLKLHSQLSGVPDSYNPEQNLASEDKASTSSEKSPNESRIGDGPFFIGQLLNKIANLDPMCKETIIRTRNKLWPRMQEREDEQREREHREREERRRRAKERQQKLMAEFADKQKQFMEKAMKSDESGVSDMDWDQGESSTTKLASIKEYDCVICSQTTPSSEDKPMGLVVLVQATSITGHARQQCDRLVLPTSDMDPPITREDTRGAYIHRRMNKLKTSFEPFSWLLSINLGWEGGVHVQTCGHHLHLDCLKSYLQSLRSQQRQQSFAVDRGEYLCPLCRQLANSVLPLSPQLGECTAVVRSRYTPTSYKLAELNNLLQELQRNPVSSNLAVAMGKAMEDITSCTYSQYKQTNCFPSHKSFFLFVTSVARTNIEIELIQRGGSLCVSPPTTIPLTPKRDCIVPLLHVLAVHARVLATWPVHHKWQKLCGVHIPDPQPAGVVKPRETEVPLLLHDPIALLIQFILLLPLHLDQTYFSIVVKMVYNLLYHQVLLQIICNFSCAERRTVYENYRFSRFSDATPMELLQIVMDNYFDNSSSTDDYKAYARVDPDSIEEQIQTLCLPFLRVAALLKYHLYEQPLPLIRTPQSEFRKLVCYLELITERVDQENFKSVVVLNLKDDRTRVSWSSQLNSYVSNVPTVTSLIREQHISWQVPKLLSLPREYEKIFSYYHERQCQQCKTVPREISICLLCGTIVCLKQNCCKRDNVCEVVQHSIDCGGGTGIYLVVTSTYIIVIRGRRACLWGSLYLDDFEEEDGDLKRGKPLYLSQERYQLLEQQWLAHRFDHMKKSWVSHRDAL